MKKMSLKPIIMSALAALAFGTVTVGTTFALFTDKAETKISVKAGKVQVDTEAALTGVWEYDGVEATNEKAVTPNSENEYINSIGGRTKLVSEGVFELSKWAPGDRARISVTGSNQSNVKTKMRLKVVMSGELAGALTLKVYQNGFDSDPTLAAVGAKTLVTDWIDVAAGTNPGDFGLDVQFKNHGVEITSREEGIDNKYQGKEANIIVTYEAVQGNANVSTSLIEKANSILATNAALGEENKTMFDALGDLETAKAGMKAQMLEAGYLWGVEEDLFYETTSIPAGHEYQYFIPSATLSPLYSTYAYNWTGSDNVNLAGLGLDMGDETSAKIATINYEGVPNTPRTNLIRSNDGANININAPLDVVHHYGNAEHVVITAVAGQSYHEYGEALLVEIKKGRIALEEDSSVKQVHFVYDSEHKEFDDIVVAYDTSVVLPKFSRDVVSFEDIQDEPKLVVELQNSLVKEEAQSDFVWLYQNGLKEQIRITDKAEPTAKELKEAPVSTDESVDSKTAMVSEQIANDIAGGATYEQLEEQGKLNEDGSIKETYVEATVKEGGITEEGKEEILDEFIFIKKGESFEVSGVGKFYTLKEAFENVESGGTIKLTQDHKYTLKPEDFTEILDKNNNNRKFNVISGNGLAQLSLCSYIVLNDKTDVKLDLNGYKLDIDCSYPFIKDGWYNQSNAQGLGKTFMYLTGDSSLNIVNGTMNVKFDYKNHPATQSANTAYNSGSLYSAIRVENSIPSNIRATKESKYEDLITKTSRLSMVNCNLNTNQVGLYLSHNAIVTELNANIRSYIEETAISSIDKLTGNTSTISYANIQDNNIHAIQMWFGSRIENISGGSYIFDDQRVNEAGLPMKIIPNPGCALHMTSGYTSYYYPGIQNTMPETKVVKISGGRFSTTGQYTIVVNGKIDEISGGVFTRNKEMFAGYKQPIRPTIRLQSGADSLGTVTGGTFACGWGSTGDRLIAKYNAIEYPNGNTTVYPSLETFLADGYGIVENQEEKYDVDTGNTSYGENGIVHCLAYDVCK